MAGPGVEVDYPDDVRDTHRLTSHVMSLLRCISYPVSATRVQLSP